MTKKKGFLLSEFLSKNKTGSTLFYPCKVLGDDMTGEYSDKDGWNKGGYNFKLYNDSDVIIITSVRNLDGRFVLKCIRNKASEHTDYNMSCKDIRIEPVSKKEYTALRKKVGEYKKKNLWMNVGHGFNVGGDPEFFFEDEKNEMIPAFKFLPPQDKALVQSSGTAFWDGFQAEFTYRAGSCLDDMTGYIRTMLITIDEKAKGFNKNARLTLTNVVNLTNEVIDNTDEEHLAFGCSPSLNIYGSQGLEGNGKDISFRTTGGHMHFGLGNNLDEEEVARIVKALDAIVGVACVSMFDTVDNPLRRTMYGLAGEYRLPKHGLEYRTLSNAWLAHPTITHLVFGLARKAVVVGQKDLLKYFKCTEKNAANIINTCNVKGARRILRNNKDFYLQLFKACYGDNSTSCELAYQAFYKGLSKVLEDPNDISGNWNLNGLSQDYHRRRFFERKKDFESNDGKLLPLSKVS